MRVAPRLRQHAFRRVDEDDGEIGERSSASHVARVLLMARRIGADEAAPVGREVAVRYIDGDALLPLGHEPVQQQRIIDGAAAATDFGVEQQGFLLIGIKQLRVIEQVSDQRGFAIINAAAGDKFQ